MELKVVLAKSGQLSDFPMSDDLRVFIPRELHFRINDHMADCWNRKIFKVHPKEQGNLLKLGQKPAN